MPAEDRLDAVDPEAALPDAAAERWVPRGEELEERTDAAVQWECPGAEPYRWEQLRRESLRRATAGVDRTKPGPASPERTEWGARAAEPDAWVQPRADGSKAEMLATIRER